jgi:hypothetical protein
MMKSDSVINEIRQTRAILSELSGGSIQRYGERIRALEEELKVSAKFRFASGYNVPSGTTAIALHEQK